MILFWFRYLHEYNLPHLIAVDISVAINARVLILILTALLGIHQSFALLLCFGSWAEHGGHSSDFLRGLLLVTFCLAEAFGMSDFQEPSIQIQWNGNNGCPLEYYCICFDYQSALAIVKLVFVLFCFCLFVCQCPAGIKWGSGQILSTA